MLIFSSSVTPVKLVFAMLSNAFNIDIVKNIEYGICSLSVAGFTRLFIIVGGMIWMSVMIA